MSSFANLPSLVISKVIEYVIKDRKQCLRTEKSAFTYLKICSYWRKIAVANYYLQAYYYDYYDDDNKTDTNLDLITSVSKTKHAKLLHFEVYHVYQFLQLLFKYRLLLKAEIHDWSQVEKFEISYYNDISVPNQVLYNGQLINLVDKFTEFAKYITGHMPKVKNISLSYLDITDATKLANNIFLKSYGKQLVSLSGHFISCFSNNYCFDNLVDIELMINPVSLQALPKLNYSRLHYLCLQRIPYTFKWNDLFQDKSIINYTFSSIKILSMQFSTDYTQSEIDEYYSQNEASNSNYKLALNFPNLKKFSIINTPSWFVAKTKHCFSSNIIETSLLNASSSHSVVSKINFKSVRNCKVVFFQENAWEDDFYRFTNSLFDIGSKCSYKKSILDIKPSLAQLDWSKTRWNNLTYIRTVTCNLQTFFTYHVYCPQLKTIKMIKMVVDMPLEKACHMFQAASNIKSELGHIVQINNTIERLRIRGFESKAASNDEFESFIKFYLCWATSLMYVKLDKSQWMGIESFIKTESQHYPSLSNIFIRY